MTQLEITDNLFAAIDIIVNKKLAELEFDRTVLVTVVEDSDTDKYTVELQGAKFEAYSINGYKYEAKDVAYMLIPRNRLAQDKFLLGPAAYYREKKEE